MKKGQHIGETKKSMNCLKAYCGAKAVKGDIYCHDHRKERDEIKE